MAPVKCYYNGCSNTKVTKSMFSFPVNYGSRLQLWIKHSGNKILKSLTRQELRHRYICEDHFDASDVIKYPRKSALVHTAVPLNYKRPVSPEYDSIKDVEVLTLCMECNKRIMGFGFQWWCLQCGGPRCSLCALRMVHRPHFLLRSPANTTPEQAEILISAIQKELQLEDFFRTRGVNQGESAELELDEIQENVLEEPIVKAEPPDQDEDPLAECSLNHSLNLQPDGVQTYQKLSSDQPNYRPNDYQPGQKDLGLDDSHEAIGRGSTDYRPSEKSLGLVNSFQYRKYLKYLDLEDSIKQRPNKGKHAIGYRRNQKRSGLGKSIDYRPRQESVDIEESSHNVKGLGGSFENHTFSGLDLGFGLFNLNEPHPNDIRHSASFKSVPIGPVVCPDEGQNPNQASLESSKSGSNGSFLQCGSGSQTLDLADKQPGNEDLHPPCNRRMLIQTCPSITEKELKNITIPLTKNSDNKTKKFAKETVIEDEPYSSEIVELYNDEPSINRTLHPSFKVYSRRKRKSTETKEQNINNNKIQPSQIQVYSIYQKRADNTVQNDSNKQQSIINAENFNEIQQRRIELQSKHETQRCKDITVPKDDDNQRENSINTTDSLIFACDSLKMYHSHNSFTAKTTEELNSESNNKRKPQNVYSARKRIGVRKTLVLEKDSKQRCINTIEDSKNGNSCQPQIQIYSTHKKKDSWETTGTKVDNSKTQRRELNENLTNKTINSTELSNHDVHDPVHVHNREQQPKIQIFTTHRVKEK